MQKKTMAIAAALCLSLNAGFAQAKPAAVGMPNPMVSYDTVSAAKAAAGFTPLYLPSMTGYHVSQVWVIAGDTIDIEYTADGQIATKFRLRTARCTELVNDNISGIYGVKWNAQDIQGIPVNIAQVPAESKVYPDGYAAHWTYNNMLFSISAENIGKPEFMHLLETGLVELSKNYF
ncbi:hypothetical protein SELR_02850 [Selenomonas ruminantium subsp. lactilytica TAM6421]|uniref:DUF4367 domain-containing protein n=1 Tax=Selenomonas ruminantium subsp. lactilytica (strain NBRC 103574 / TAM6421) TaxID=927704 RepID=I0GMK6_SELRL|nr:hypothetical protein [Selenomonas ruminantium]BAL81993.1 hypothetical protein SELR_02850 [Selenomonas ruminantium subsp. lactilytica TAM6421]